MTNTTVNIPVGAGALLNSAVNGTSAQNASYTWKVGNTTVKSYTIDPTNWQTCSAPVPLGQGDTNQASVGTYYYIDTGQKTVQLSVTINGQTATAQMTYQISGPTTVTFKGTETADNPTVHMRTATKVGGGPTYMSFGSLPAVAPAVPSPGITYAGSVTTDGVGQGQFEIIQLIQETGTLTNSSDGSQQTLDTGGYVLDDDGGGHIPYHNTVVAIGNSASQSIPANANMHDNPDQDADGCAVVTVAFAFHTYLMYQPTGGIWVTISEFDWSCGGTATLNPANPPNPPSWTVSGVSPAASGAVINGAASTSLPHWGDYYHDPKLDWKK